MAPRLSSASMQAHGHEDENTIKSTNKLLNQQSSFRSHSFVLDLDEEFDKQHRELLKAPRSSDGTAKSKKTALPLLNVSESNTTRFATNSSNEDNKELFDDKPDDTNEENFSRTPGTTRPSVRIYDDADINSDIYNFNHTNLSSKSYSIPLIGKEPFMDVSGLDIDHNGSVMRDHSNKNTDEIIRHHQPSLIYQNLSYQDLISDNVEKNVNFLDESEVSKISVHHQRNNNENKKNDEKNNVKSVSDINDLNENKFSNSTHDLINNNRHFDLNDELSLKTKSQNLNMDNDDDSSNQQISQNSLAKSEINSKTSQNLSKTTLMTNPSQSHSELTSPGLVSGFFVASPNFQIMNHHHPNGNRSALATPIYTSTTPNTPAFFFHANSAIPSNSNDTNNPSNLNDTKHPSLKQIPSPIFVPFHFDSNQPISHYNEINASNGLNGINGDQPMGFLASTHFEFFPYSGSKSGFVNGIQPAPQLLSNNNPKYSSLSFHINGLGGNRKNYSNRSNHNLRNNRSKDNRSSTHSNFQDETSNMISKAKTDVDDIQSYNIDDFPSLGSSYKEKFPQEDLIFSHLNEIPNNNKDDEDLTVNNHQSNLRMPYLDEQYHPWINQQQLISNAIPCADQSICTNHIKTPQQISIQDQKNMRLIDEYRTNGPNNIALVDFIDDIQSLSCDQHGSRFVQVKLEKSPVDDRCIIFQKLLPACKDLMLDVFGNYVVQKLLEFGTSDHRKQLCNLMLDDAVLLATNTYGCRVIQKAIEVLESDMQVKIINQLRPAVLQCIKDQNGNHVVQKCIECVSLDNQDFLIEALKGNLVDVATHSFGCRVIQRLLERYANDLHKILPLIEELLEDVSYLIVNQFGNYVVQHLLEHCNRDIKSRIIVEITQNFISFSKQKFASNVCESCIIHGNDSDRQKLIFEIFGRSTPITITSSSSSSSKSSMINNNNNTNNSAKDPSSVLLPSDATTTNKNNNNQQQQQQSSSLNLSQLQLSLMRDQYANYVIQKLLENATRRQREHMLTIIKSHGPVLRKSVHGKHLIIKADKMLRNQFGNHSDSRYNHNSHASHHYNNIDQKRSFNHHSGVPMQFHHDFPKMPYHHSICNGNIFDSNSSSAPAGVFASMQPHIISDDFNSPNKHFLKSSNFKPDSNHLQTTKMNLNHDLNANNQQNASSYGSANENSTLSTVNPKNSLHDTSSIRNFSNQQQNSKLYYTSPTHHNHASAANFDGNNFMGFMNSNAFPLDFTNLYIGNSMVNSPNDANSAQWSIDPNHIQMIHPAFYSPAGSIHSHQIKQNLKIDSTSTSPLASQTNKPDVLEVFGDALPPTKPQQQTVSSHLHD